MGITLGFTALLAHMLAMWAVGAFLLRRRQGVEATDRFNRLMTSRLVLLVLTLACAPTEAT